MWIPPWLDTLRLGFDTREYPFQTRTRHFESLRTFPDRAGITRGRYKQYKLSTIFSPAVCWKCPGIPMHPNSDGIHTVPFQCRTENPNPTRHFQSRNWTHFGPARLPSVYQGDVLGLTALLLAPVPPQRRARPCGDARVHFVFGDASGDGFATSDWTRSVRGSGSC